MVIFWNLSIAPYHYFVSFEGNFANLLVVIFLNEFISVVADADAVAIKKKVNMYRCMYMSYCTPNVVMSSQNVFFILENNWSGLNYPFQPISSILVVIRITL